MKITYGNLIRELAVTDFKLKYNGSFFGYLWSLVKPLFFFLVLYVVFTKIFKLGNTIPNYPIYLLLGITLWSFFAETTNLCMNSIVGRGDLIRKVYFPKMILPISSSISSLITLSLNLIVVFGFAVFTGINFSINLIYLPIFILEIYFFTLGVSFFLASLFVKYRDISHIWEVFSQALFYATPVIYPITLIPDGLLHIIMLNPVAQIIQDFRRVIISTDIPSAVEINGIYGYIPYILVIIIYVIGYKIFQKMAVKFAEQV